MMFLFPLVDKENVLGFYGTFHITEFGKNVLENLEGLERLVVFHSLPVVPANGVRSVDNTVEEPRAFIDGFYECLADMRCKAVPGVRVYYDGFNLAFVFYERSDHLVEIGSEDGFHDSW